MYLFLLVKLLVCKGHCFSPNACLQFQKQKYARLEWFRSGKKGYGLKLLEDIRKGQFLIEYVGEVTKELSRFFFILYLTVNP
jgi:SET domain-containing protein